MATIKSFTDIPQSQVLAKFLPLESADMKWYFWKSEIDAPKLPTFGYSKTAAEDYKDTEAVYLPCWSLSALLDVLPSGYTIVKNYHDFYFVESRDHGKSTNIFNNPIDACYELILKLHELNLL